MNTYFICFFYLCKDLNTRQHSFVVDVDTNELNTEHFNQLCIKESSKIMNYRDFTFIENITKIN